MYGVRKAYRISLARNLNGDLRFDIELIIKDKMTLFNLCYESRLQTVLDIGLKFVLLTKVIGIQMLGIQW